MSDIDTRFDDFISELKRQMKAEKLSEKNLNCNTLSNGTVNFAYRDWQIGRVYFGKRSSKMQIIDSGNVEWLENRPFEEYIKNISKWLDYAKSLETEEEKSLKKLGLK